MKYLSLLFIILIFCGCSSQDTSHQEPRKVVEIAGRDDGSSLIRPRIYRMKVPSSWIQQNPFHQTSLVDTTKAIVEFFINDTNEQIRISIHNFPSDTMRQRIAPIAQVNRWQRQFQTLEAASVFIKPQAFGGYYGFRLEATGMMKDVKISILGWTLQLATEHYQALSRPVSPTVAQKYRQMRSDVTIKVLGPASLMLKHQEDIISSARSFQLIDEIP